MRTFLPYLICATLLLSKAFTVSAQTDNMEKALDRYEAICEDCIALKERSMKGEAVSSEELLSLLEQVKMLKSTIQQGSGKMTPSQKKRFEKIRQRYSDAFSTDRGKDAEGDEALAKGQGQGGSGRKATEAMDGSSTLSTLPFPPLHTGVRPLEKTLRQMVPALRHQGEGKDSGIPSAKADAARGAFTGVLALGGWEQGIFTGGGMFAMCFGKAGFYVKGRSDFKHRPYDYTCSGNGTTASGFIWTSGKSLRSSWSVGAGGIVPLGGPFSLYAGPLYGSRSTLWEDWEGRWAKVEDYSAKGPGADAGILFRKGRFIAEAGAGTVMFRTVSLEIGLGICF